jgi:hypothetical protein
MKWFPAVAVFALILIKAGSAGADPRLDEKVYDPYIQNGVAEFELRNAQALGGPLGGAATTVMEAEYGLNDRLSLALVGTLARGPGETFGFDGLGLEAVGYVGQIPGVGVDTGLYLEYTKGLRGQDDAAEAKLLFAKTAGRFQGLLNLILERPLGVPAGQGYASYGYATSVTWQTVGALRLGAEAFGDFGNDHRFLGRQGAYVGPQVKWEGRLGTSPIDLDLDAGWLAAVGESRNEASSEVRIALELERRF